MISSDFKEKTSGRIELKTFSPPAVRNMVRFLYGLELEFDVYDPLTLDILLDVAEMGALYSIEGLKEEALGEALDETILQSYNPDLVDLTDVDWKNNVFKILQFAKQHNMEAVTSKCAEFISRSFSFEETKKAEESLSGHPEIFIKILELKENENIQRRPSVVPFFEYTRCQSYWSDHEFSLSLRSSEDISVTGFGLFLSAGSSGKQHVRVKSEQGCTIDEQTVQNKDGTKTVVPVFWKKEVMMMKNVFYRFILRTGIDLDHETHHMVGRPQEGKRIKTKCSLGDAEEVEIDATVLTVPGRDKLGHSAGDVHFTVSQEPTSPWAELYFYVGQQVNN